MEYSIKDVTLMFSLNASTLRYYEQIGLLPPIKKNASKQRVYCEKDIDWLKIITCMRKTGMSISYIKKYIDLCHEGSDTVDERYQIFLDQKKIIEQQMQELQENMKTVEHKIKFYQDEVKKNHNPMNPEEKHRED